VSLLERKVAVIQDELAYIEREQESLTAELHKVRQGVGSSPRVSIEPEPESERELEALRQKAEREAKDQAVQQQLDLLKKKLGKQ
jgi:hypothetical protein